MGVLRLLLAVAVFAFHSHLDHIGGMQMLNGRTAVFCFFVVSGFYMEMVLAEKYTFDRLGRRWFYIFWLSRFGDCILLI